MVEELVLRVVRKHAALAEKAEVEKRKLREKEEQIQKKKLEDKKKKVLIFNGFCFNLLHHIV